MRVPEKKKVPTLSMLRWVRLISFADLLTLANGLIGFVAITFILRGDGMSFHIATMLIFVAMLVDGFDGVVARRFGTKHNMGRHLDSISDSISFCMAPAILLYVTYHDKTAGFTPQNVLALVAAMLVLGLGILRLARYTMKAYARRNFTGIPTPAMTFFILTACEVFGMAPPSPPPPYPPFISYEPFVVLPLTILLSFFMVMDFQYPKVRPRGRNFAIVAILVALMAAPAAILWFVATPYYYVLIKWVVLSTFLAIVLYLLFGPLYVRLRKIADKNEMTDETKSALGNNAA